MSDVNFRAMLCASNDSETYFDIIKRAIAFEAMGDSRAKLAWQNAAKRGARLERAAGGDVTGFDAAICAEMLRDQYEDSIHEDS